MRIKKVVFLALAVAIGAALAGVFALERNHHGKGKAIHLAGKNFVKNVSFVLPPGETTPPPYLITRARQNGRSSGAIRSSCPPENRPLQDHRQYENTGALVHRYQPASKR